MTGKLPLRPDPYDKYTTDPMIQAGMGTSGWWLYKDLNGVHHAMPMKSSTLKGKWQKGMTWTYDANEVRAWLEMSKG